MKNILAWICVLLLSVIGFVGYRYMHPSLRMHFVYRSALLTNEQVDYMRAHPDEEPVCLAAKDLFLKPVNIVVQIINEGEIYTGGPLYCRIEGENDWHEIDVDEIAPRGSKAGSSSKKYVIPLGIQSVSQGEKPVYVDIDVFKMWVANRPGNHSGKQYFRPNFKYEYYLRSDKQIERVGDVSF